MLISAPAGYGKSQLCSCWIDRCGVPTAWLSLDDDDDPRHFLQHVLAGVSALFPDVLDTTSSLVEAGQLPPVSLLADSLVEELDTIEERFVLVLDDLHRVRGGPILDLIADLMRYPPRPLHLVLISRRDPPLPLAKWRAAGTMSEIRGHDLRFGRAETAELLKGLTGLAVNEHALDTIEQRIEGWVVGLRLAALALRRVDDVDSLIARLSGGFLNIQDYLVREVLAGQSLQMRDWLLKTSILDQFCGPLCDAVCRDEDELAESALEGAGFLEALQASNLFTISLDAEGTWFRYHHLFQKLLFDQLENRLSREAIAELHARASHWLEREGYVREAVEHAIDGGHEGNAAEIVERGLSQVMVVGPRYPALNWLSLLPDELILSRPKLILGRAYLHTIGQEFTKLPPLLDRVDALRDRDRDDDSTSRLMSVLRGVCDFHTGHHQRSLGYLEAIIDGIPSDEGVLDAMAVVHFCLSSHAVGQGLRVRTLAAGWLQEPAIEAVREIYINTSLRHLNFIEADLPAVDLGIRGDRDLAETYNLDQYVSYCDYYLGLSCFFKADFAAAERHLRDALNRKYTLWRRTAIDTLACLTITYQALGRADKAADSLQELREFVNHLGGPTVILADSCATRLQILQGRMGPAGWWHRPTPFDTNHPFIMYFEVPSITRCRALIAEGTAAGLSTAQEELAALMEKCEAEHNVVQRIVLWCLQSVALDKQGRDAEALTALEHAVALARPAGFVFQFVEFGRPMRELLERLPPEGAHAAFVGHILDACGESADTMKAVATPQHGTDDHMIEPLTDRETDVLHLLGQRLFDKEIAAELHITRNTVNTHCKNIYSKLGVRSRREAVAKGIEFGLIADV